MRQLKNPLHKIPKTDTQTQFDLTFNLQQGEERREGGNIIFYLWLYLWLPLPVCACACACASLLQWLKAHASKVGFPCPLPLPPLTLFPLTQAVAAAVGIIRKRFSTLSVPFSFLSSSLEFVFNSPMISVELLSAYDYATKCCILFSIDLRLGNLIMQIKHFENFLNGNHHLRI